jgi:GNAT superfamily N-acetyltransferase
LCPWLDLYETSFPPEERTLVSFFLTSSKALTPITLFWPACTSGRLPPGLLTLIPEQRLAWFWYLAVAPTLQGRGLGATLYRDMLARLPADTRAVLLEVERPDLAETAAQRAVRERRIALYRRLGARTLGGVHYLQFVGPHQPPISHAGDAPSLEPLERRLPLRWRTPSSATRDANRRADISVSHNVLLFRFCNLLRGHFPLQ